MKSETSAEDTSLKDIAKALSNAWGSVEAILSGNLGTILGITYSEYRLLDVLGWHGETGASRVNLAQAVGLTPSAVTRALRPLTELGYIESVPHQRDARQSIAKLTANGIELLANAENLLDDVTDQMTDGVPSVVRGQGQLLLMLDELAATSGRAG